ncbi:FAD:protein FMN transferase [Sinomonas sp. ASV486]|uniref:FAD:protein FMN transferase n=1 Tax=Sinomonas sp. ASV486 TaxID=3051170 RepID=UPI0027DB0F95|nr:FAD:protein FMN transferase [Sinomonas sp. ASV486]MDQ4490424.1 FAD:protein FMN transferase [Sinomonas sp. ASV486]
MPASADFEAFTCECRLVVSDPAALGPALELVRDLLHRVDEAASRFRPDSELNRLVQAGGGTVSPLLAGLLDCALDTAERSRGAVVPTLGRPLAELGFGPAPVSDASASPVASEVAGTSSVVPRIVPAESWRDVRLDGSVLTVPPGVVLDLGATAKAASADLAAREVFARFETSVLVSLGGDIATAGSESWEVLVQDLPSDPVTQVRLDGGWAIATSSTQKRRARQSHAQHILDPWTSLPAPELWRSVSVAAPDCLSANMASTGAVVLGTRGVAWLRELGYPARLVRSDGDVVELNGWPPTPAAFGTTFAATAAAGAVGEILQ